jgi:hypothetical protein
MQLLTKELIKEFNIYGSQENDSDPVVIAKFFSPVGAGTWLATEFDPKTKLFFGYVSLFNTPHENEFGYFSLEELESIRLPFGLKIERDRYFSPAKLSEVKRRANIH